MTTAIRKRARGTGTASRPIPDPLTREQVAAILAVPNVRSARGLRYRAILETLYRAGLRISEALALAPEDVRFVEKRLRIRHAKGNKFRNVPMEPALQAWLEAWDATRPESPWFFAAPNNPDKPMLQRTVWKAIDGYVKKAAEAHPELGLDRRGPVSAHTFRHTFATELIEEGIPLPHLQTLLGHADISTTAIYTHVRNEYVEQFMRKRGQCAAGT